MFGIKRKSNFTGQNVTGNIRFNQGLIEELIVQQSDIYADYKSLTLSIRNDSILDIESKLVQFKRDFQTHLMNKKVRLYAYLKNELDLTVTQAHVINKARLTGSEVSRSTNQFLEKYLQNGKLTIDKEQLPNMSDELKDIGTLMVASMREERDRVFPLYCSADS